MELYGLLQAGGTNRAQIEKVRSYFSVARTLASSLLIRSALGRLLYRYSPPHRPLQDRRAGGSHHDLEAVRGEARVASADEGYDSGTLCRLPQLLAHFADLIITGQRIG